MINTTHYVYELINLYGTVEYVGESKNPYIRFRQHTKWKPNRANGKFYRRQDIMLNIVASFNNRKEALTLEGKLKIEYGLEWTEKTCVIKGGKIGGRISGKKKCKKWALG